ncbi:MAG TPA: response regulator transcription factor, partial [Terriglobales bacterium]
PLLNGIDAAAILKRSKHSAKIVFLTMHRELSYAVKAYELGASAYVLKHSSPDELIGAIRIALRGEKYVPPSLAGPLLEQYRSAPAGGSTEIRLTPRERQVLQLLAEGRCAKETASLLNISPRTVEFHKYRIMEGLGFKSTAELVRFAMHEGLVS